MEVFRLDLELVKNRPDLLSTYESWLSPAERERFLQIRDEKRKLEFLGGHALLHDVVGMMKNCPPQEVKVDLRDGVPFLDAIPLFVSLSHSGGLVAVTADEQPVGLDIERSSARRNLSAIVEKCFGPETARTYSLLKETERRPFFFRAWTMREAAYKWHTFFAGKADKPVHFHSGIVDDMYFTVASANPLVSVTMIAKVPGEAKEMLLSPKELFLV